MIRLHMKLINNVKTTASLCAIVILIGILVSLSCKKETSCEGCNGNSPPVAIAGQDQFIILPTDSVLLDGSNSSDPDGTIMEWRWRKISGPATFSISNSSSA